MIKFIKGNLFDTDAQIICHQCNCYGVMGSGVAKEVKQRYPNVFKDYRNDYENGKLKLGYVCFSPTENCKGQIIANMCGQNYYGYSSKQYTDYNKLQECFNKVVEYAKDKYNSTKPKIAFPYRMSCCRGGGDWNVVLKMIENTFRDFEVEIWRLEERH